MKKLTVFAVDALYCIVLYSIVLMINFGVDFAAAVERRRLGFSRFG